MKILNDKNYKKLVQIFESNETYSHRVRAHIPVLYEKNFDIDHICRIYDTNRQHIYVLLNYINYFGIIDYFTHELSELQKRVEAEKYRREQLNLKKRKNLKSLSYYFVYPLKIIFSFLLNLSEMLIVFVAYLTSIFLPDRPTAKKNDIKNSAIIEKGSSYNYIVQIGTLNVNGEENVEHLITNSKDELVQKVEELIKSENKFEFGNKHANKLFDKAQKEYRDRSMPKDPHDSNVKFYAMLIIGVILYTSTFKGGISSITFFGVVIIVSLRACMPNSTYDTDTLTTLKPSLNQIDSSGSTKVVDSMETVDQKDKIAAVENIQEYKRVVPEWYEYDANCLALSAMGLRQKKFIKEYDLVDHYNENYYIDQYDDMYYVHVVSYKDIREAAFQMYFINDKTEFNSMILESLTSQGTLYAVVIGKFKGDEISEICSLIEKWNLHCVTGNAEIGFIYNG